MILDQHIKEVALLGTNRRKIEKAKLPSVISEAMTEKEDEGHETRLLNAMAIDLFYKEAGTVPPQYEGEITGEPIIEEKTIAPIDLIKIFKVIQEVDGPVRNHLFSTWCKVLIRHNWILSAREIIPAIKEGVRLKKSSRAHVVQIIGKKGAWAILQNEEYKIAYNTKSSIPVNNIWEEGTSDQRYIQLLQKRQNAPSEAQEMLNDTWNTESIHDKIKFLTAIQSTATKADIPFLESLHRGEFKYSAKEKAKQVACRRIIAETLLMLPDSDLNKHTVIQIKKYVQLPAAKNFFKKLLSNDSPKLELPEKTDDFWNPLMMTGVFGFEEKNVDIGLFKSDALYWFSCLVQVIPIQEWNDVFGFENDQCLEYFTSNESFLYTVKGTDYSCLIPALKKLATIHQNTRIANYILGIKNQEKDAKLLSLLTPEQWEKHIIQNELFFESAVLRSGRFENGQEWSRNFSEKLVSAILKKLRTQASIYDYQIGQYAAMSFNEDSISMLEKRHQTETSSLKSSAWWERHFYEPIMQAANVKTKLKKYNNGNA